MSTYLFVLEFFAHKKFIVFPNTRLVKDYEGFPIITTVQRVLNFVKCVLTEINI
jgi:hypothetical protein